MKNEEAKNKIAGRIEPMQEPNAKPKFKNKKEEKEYEYNLMASRMSSIQLYSEIKKQKEFIAYLNEKYPTRVLQSRNAHVEFLEYIERYLDEHLT